jgi:hypothetical protein
VLFGKTDGFYSAHVDENCSFGPPFSVRALAKSVWAERPTPIRGLWPPPGAQTKAWVSPRMRPSLSAVLPFGMVLVLGNSADTYCAVAQAQSLSQVKSSQVLHLCITRIASEVRIRDVADSTRCSRLLHPTVSTHEYSTQQNCW